MIGYVVQFHPRPVDQQQGMSSPGALAANAPQVSVGSDRPPNAIDVKQQAAPKRPDEHDVEAMMVRLISVPPLQTMQSQPNGAVLRMGECCRGAGTLPVKDNSSSSVRSIKTQL